MMEESIKNRFESKFDDMRKLKLSFLVAANAVLGSRMSISAIHV